MSKTAFGLIGNPLSHSFSQAYFTQKFKAENIESTYKNIEINDLNIVRDEINKYAIQGFNVTIPFKQEIISHLDELDSDAEVIGAVNVVKIEGAKWKGYNTDHEGFRNSIESFNLEKKKALILGDGGAAKAVKYAFKTLGIPFDTVSRKGKLKFTELTTEYILNHKIIVNTTPVGSFSNPEELMEIPFNGLTQQHLLYDLVYNPEKTKFLSIGEQRGCTIKNGKEMLERQAELSWKIWNQ